VVETNQYTAKDDGNQKIANRTENRSNFYPNYDGSYSKQTNKSSKNKIRWRKPIEEIL
jgi:hypothetical protein